MSDISERQRELLPCPFCGGPAAEYRETWKLKRVSCAQCDTSTEVDTWNRRTALTPPDGYVLVERSKLPAVRVARLAVLQKEAEADQMEEPHDASMWADCASDLDAIAPRQEVSGGQ